MSRFLISMGLAALLGMPLGFGCRKSDEKSGPQTDPRANADNATPVERTMIGRWELDRKATDEAKLSQAARPGGLGYQFNADGTGVRRVGTNPADAVRWKTITVDGQSITLSVTDEKPGGHDSVVTLSLILPDQLRVKDDAGTSVLRRTVADVSVPQTDHLHEAVRMSPAASFGIDLGPALRLAVSRDGHWLVVRGGLARGNFTLWDLTSQSQKFAIDQTGVSAMPVAISPDGTMFATANYLGASTWDASSGKRIGAFPHKPGEGGLPVALRFARGPTLIAAAGKDIIGWNIETSEQIFSIRADPSEVSALAIFPNGRRIASGGKDGKIHVWDIPEGTIAREIDPGEGKPPSALAVNSDAGHLAAAINGGDIHIFDLPGGGLSRKITSGSRIDTLLFLPDNKTLAYPSHVEENWDIIMTDIETGEARATLRGHTDRITSMDLTADGDTLVSVSDDKTIRTWDLRALNALQSRPEFSR